MTRRTNDDGSQTVRATLLRPGDGESAVAAYREAVAAAEVSGTAAAFAKYAGMVAHSLPRKQRKRWRGSIALACDGDLTLWMFAGDDDSFFVRHIDVDQARITSPDPALYAHMREPIQAFGQDMA
jgi:hypothetical protein